MIHRLKFQVPVSHVDLIERPALVDRLSAGLHRKCTFVRAPAGYGKTTLLSQWRRQLSHNDVASLWINLDEADSAPKQFALTLNEGLQVWAMTIGAEAGVPLFQNAEHPELAVEHALTAFARDLRSGVIFLEDYNLARSDDLDKLLEHTIARLPGNLHLVIASRGGVQFSVASLQAQGQVTEIVANDLMFTDEQVRDLLGHDVAPDLLGALQHRLSGWPVAVQLLKLCLKSRQSARDVQSAVVQSQENMAEYLTSQVMSSLSDRACAVMVASSIVEEVNADLANAICERDDCDDIFEEIRQIDALVRTIGEDRTWLRFHQLLREFLAGKLAAKGEDHARALHIKASAWFEAKALFFPAVRHAALGGDMARAARLVEAAGAVRVALVGSLAELERMLNLFPLEHIYKHPRLHVAHAWMLAKRGRIREARDSYEAVRESVVVSQDSSLRLEALFVDSMMMAVYEDEAWKPQVLADVEALARVVSPVDHWLQGWIKNTLCTIHTRHGAFDAARDAADAAISHYENAGSDYGKAFMQLHLALINLLDGRLGQARSWIDAASRAARRSFSSDAGLVGLIDVVDGQILYEQNRTGEAKPKLRRALRDIESAEGWVEIYGGGFRALSGLLHDDDGLEAALALLDEGRAVAAKRNLPRLSWSCDCRSVELLTLAERFEEAQAFADRTNVFFQSGVPEYISWRERRNAFVVEARLALCRGDALGCLKLMRTLKSVAQQNAHPRLVMEASILEALACNEVDDRDGATGALKGALALAVPEGFSRRFVEEGDRMARLLQSTVRSLGIANMPEATVEFIAAVMSVLKGSAADADGAGPAHILSAREIEVLKELDLGHATKVIARHLNLSDATVKFHLSNIYKKFGVNSRKMAITVAHQKKLL